ncbi:hypothetical protein F5887DRAFT_1072911 [Amanita rubescens]|nr:hypothetical protein F5887DRAFT_1072911 [Amanita rubescens]
MLRGAFRAAPPVSSDSSNSRPPSGGAHSDAGHRDNNSDSEEWRPPFTQIPPNDEIVSNSSSSLSRRSYSLGTDYTPRTRRKMKVYALNVCQSLNIPASLMTQFTELPSPAHMLIDLKASLIRVERLHGTSKAMDKLKDEEFKSSLTERLWIILISPNLTAYRTGIVEHIMSKIHDSPANFGVDQELIEDMDAVNKIKRMVGSILTKTRGIMKQKLMKSICTKSNVVKLTRKLAPPHGLVLTAAHWNRVAFLRACLMELEKIKPPHPTNGAQDDQIDANTSAGDASAGDASAGDDGAPSNDGDPDDSGQNGTDGESDDEDGSEDSLDASNQYWVFVDKQLAKFRAKALKLATLEQPAEEVLRCAFNRTCANDIRMFQGQGQLLQDPGAHGNRRASPWQREMEDFSIW